MQTRIRKVEGNCEQLRQHLLERFNLDPERVFVNNLTKHVIIKGHWKKKVDAFLTEKNF